ncbi:PREDICTED: putative F-box protein At1g65770 isoform X2 [Populus euphratica]|uniref:F-box protein At1g65770 isoform X2 n=1 Tax=Populus euphratica TaxID=75702 RepID=A0AAJ6XKT2_POPEU|nr:PREDICTED: putative F-box protein At1g65770 isoform X2 [Populus euphratica]
MSQWADLPKELLEMISKRLDLRVEVLRFRAVCSSWRCSVSPPSFDQEIPPLFLKLPPPFRTLDPIFADAVLMQTTICRMEFLCNYSNSSCSLAKSSLVKVGESKHGKLQPFHPLSNQETKDSFMSLNLLDLKFVQLSKACLLKWPGGISVYGINKVVVFPLSAGCIDNCELGILAIYHEGKLGYWRYGDKEWTLLDDRNFEYDDIIVYEGQFYVVDRWGTVSWIDSSLKVIQYSPPLYGCGGQKNLVESCGDLYVVDRYLDGERRTWKDYEDVMDTNDNPLCFWRLMNKARPMTVDFRVYKLDEEWGTWVDIKSLGDRIFILGVDCSFSVSCRDLSGGKGNCIYFYDSLYVGERMSGGAIHVFRFEDHSIDNLAVIPDYSEIFWPANIGSSA